MVKLKDVADMMDMQNETMHAYLHRHSGEIMMLADDTLADAEGEPDRADYADWEREEQQLAKQVLETDIYLRLPDSVEINQFSIMERFCHSLDDERGVDILNQLGGAGSFRRFRQALEHHDLTDDWYQYKQAALEEIAAEWLTASGIRYEEASTDPSLNK